MRLSTFEDVRFRLQSMLQVQRSFRNKQSARRETMPSQLCNKQRYGISLLLALSCCAIWLPITDQCKKHCLLQSLFQTLIALQVQVAYKEALRLHAEHALPEDRLADCHFGLVSTFAKCKLPTHS